MDRTSLVSLGLALTLLAGCPQEEEPPPADDDAEEPTPPAPVNGWILLDSDPDAVVASLDAAVEHGVDTVQLSHGLIMDIDDILGDDAGSQEMLQRLRFAAQEADDRGIRTHIWAHEWSDVGPAICYDPGDPVWEQRADAYREGLALVPELDGVVLMYGSADFPPWFTACACDYCTENWPDGGLFEAPPNDERIRMMTQALGDVIVGELGKELVGRTFIHEPQENAWHAEGFGAVEGVPFVGMHKSDVQDWQPYNPHSPTMGAEGDLYHLLEVDVAGEYYGLSELPFCAPAYFAWRLDHSRANRGFGTVARVQRGGHTALGTPNEVNVALLTARHADPDAPVAGVWDAWIESFYGLAPGSDESALLRQILDETFAVRLKSHYVLGIWALDKGSDIPDGFELDQLHDRGDMPKWDPAWQDHYDALVEPDRAAVVQVWQEGDEAVALALASLTASEALEGALEPDAYADLQRRLQHQWFAARAWRGVKLVIWCRMAISAGHGDPDLEGWMVWAHEDLGTVADELEQAKLGVSLASPADIEGFREATVSLLPPGVKPLQPEVPGFPPMRTEQLEAGRVVITVGVDHDATLTLDHGLMLPDPESSIDLGPWEGGQTQSFELTGLQPRQRYVFRLRADVDGTEYRSGYHWVFTPAG